jgi:hypothetical protein
VLGRMRAEVLVAPYCTLQDVGRFRIFGATLTQMPGWCSDLKYAAALGNSVWHLWRPKPSRSVKGGAGQCSALSHVQTTLLATVPCNGFCLQ